MRGMERSSHIDRFITQRLRTGSGSGIRVQRFVPPSGKRVGIWGKDAASEGLYVLVAPGGSRLWRLAYRFNGKQKTLALGHYPHVSLLNARRARDGAKRLLRAGIDPSVDRKMER